ncbi:hypothetical protein [Lacipirellula parvula]|uniref:hypothetical protein n=1 Tax=Lacipirellula parvula TaxID=2650471 RepID=UPI001E51A431|nr:hypothetical protein [Lacipirellula parvula]
MSALVCSSAWVFDVSRKGAEAQRKTKRMQMRERDIAFIGAISVEEKELIVASTLVLGAF